MEPNNHDHPGDTLSPPPASDPSFSSALVEQDWVTLRTRVGIRITVFAVSFIAFIVFLAFALSRLAHVLELFTIGLLLAMAINPAVAWFEKRHTQRWVSVTALVLLLAGVVIGGLASLAPTLVDQSTRFINDAPQIGNSLQQHLKWLDHRFPAAHVAELANRLQSEASQSLSGIQSTATTVFTASVTTVVEAVLVVFLVVFVLSDPHPLVRGLRGVMPPQWQPEVTRIGELVVAKVQAWIQGSLILMLFIAVLDTIGLLVLGVPYALLWGVLSGLLEIIPTLGPIIAAVPPAIVGLTMPHPVTALYILGLYVVIQQIESNVLVPVVMSNKVRLHPVTLLCFLLVMAEFLGVFGALIATPLAATLKVLYMELYYRRLHGALPPEEANDPTRLKLKRRRARKATEDAAP
ncbi:MAG TPA: AI-2E family transporter [Armatimonadota bacterium]|jgi:predicted PurR-regulated permease PerM